MFRRLYIQNAELKFPPRDIGSMETQVHISSRRGLIELAYDSAGRYVALRAASPAMS